MEGVEAVNATSAGKQVSISAATGGSYVTAPLYSTGWVAGVQVSMPDAGILWDSGRGAFTKKTSMFQPNQQYGNLHERTAIPKSVLLV